MFFGLEVKSNENQAKPITLANTVKFSHAVLDPKTNGKKEPVCLVAEYNKKQFILCVLDPSHGTWQVPLDLLFEGGSQVKFFLRGSGTLHLTGYENFDDMDDMSMSMSDEEEELSDLEEEPVPQLVSASKKAKDAKKTNGFKGSAKKNAKKDGDDDEEADDEENESDDEDFDADLDLEDDDDDDDGDDDDDDEMDDEDIEEDSDDE